MVWRQIEIFTSAEGIELLCGELMDLGVSGFSIRDAADFNELLQGDTCRWDCIDEDLLRMRDCESSVTFYLPTGEQGEERLERARELTARLKSQDNEGVLGRLDIEISDVEEENWESSWKKYYKPVKTGERLVICPTWEAYDAVPGEVVVRLDPGMAFGTGTHASTRLCLALTENFLHPGARVLDLGCGSGILGISALLLGAEESLGVDIDEVAVGVARENAGLNGVAERACFARANLADGINERYDLIFANIIADVILRLIPDIPRLLAPGGALIASGIIDTRAEEVRDALYAAGLQVAEQLDSEGWVAMVVKSC